jgi:putative membrane protein
VVFFIHIVIILLAAKYTYEAFYPFEWLKETLGLSRNYFDRLGHFFQGFTPVMLLRELYIKEKIMQTGPALFVTMVLITLGLSGAWEISELVFSWISGKTEVLLSSMQGDVWDAQQDMMICTVGAIIALILLSEPQDKEIAKLEGE